MNRSIGAFITALAAIVSVGLGFQRAGERDPDVVFTNVRVFDGIRVLPPTIVAVSHGVIASIGRAPTGSDAVRVEGSDATLLPGLIDAHVHVGGRRDALQDAARFGVTAVVDLFERLPARMQTLRRTITEQPSYAEADYFSAGAGATVKGGHACCSEGEPTISQPSEAETFVNDRVAEGSEYIKIIVERGFAGKPLPTLDPATVRALIAAAHRHGRIAVVHATTPEDVRVAVEAGADGLAHLWVSSRGGPGDDERLIALIKARDVFVIPTLTMMEALTSGAGSAALLADRKLAPFLTESAKTNLNPARAGSLTDPLEMAYENVRRLHRAGVRILAGTDAPNAGVEHGISLHRELELLVLARIPPIDALRAATSSAATALRLPGHGRILEGVPADLVLVKGDPTRDILATRDIVAIWKNGRQLDRQPPGRH